MHDFMNRALLNCDLPTSWVDALGNRVTRNLGSLGGTVQLGDGVTPAMFPTQVFPHGMSFDGGDYLERASEAALSFTAGGGVDLPFSFEVLTVNGAGQGNGAGIISKGRAFATWEYLFSFTGTAVSIYTTTPGGANYLGRTGPEDSRCSLVSHWVATYDGSKTFAGYAIYRNAQRVDTANMVGGSYTGMVASGEPVCFGQGGGIFGWENGSLFNAAIYPFALQPGEVAQLCRQRFALLQRGF